MPQGSSQPAPRALRPGRPHRVAVIVDEGTNPFEVGVATELFGLPRPELGLPAPLYDVTLCAPTPRVRMNHGFFTLTNVAGLDAVDDATTEQQPATYLMWHNPSTRGWAPPRRLTTTSHTDLYPSPHMEARWLCLSSSSNLPLLWETTSTSSSSGPASSLLPLPPMERRTRWPLATFCVFATDSASAMQTAH